MALPTESAAPPTSLRHWKYGVLVFVAVFLLWLHLTIGLRPEHFILVLVFAGLFWIHETTAHFAYRAVPFFAVGIIYENIRWLFPLRPTVHIADLYYADLNLFGIGGETL